MGSDLNRHWQAPSQWAQPTIYATKNLLLRYNANPVSDILIIFIYRYLITNQLNLNPIFKAFCLPFVFHWYFLILRCCFNSHLE